MLATYCAAVSVSEFLFTKQLDDPLPLEYVTLISGDLLLIVPSLFLVGRDQVLIFKYCSLIVSNCPLIA